MRGRLPVGYVVRIEGSDVTLNLLDLHRGQLASHAQGVLLWLNDSGHPDRALSFAQQ